MRKSGNLTVENGKVKVIHPTYKTRRPNKFRISGGVVYLKLTQGQEALVDFDDLEALLRFRWYARWCNHSHSYRVHGNVVCEDSSRTVVGLPAILLGSWGRNGSVQVDHINHNTLDNRRENLRLVDASENQLNRTGSQRNSSTGVRGVWLRKDVVGNGVQLSWRFTCSHGTNGYCCTKKFPYTDAGLRAAAEFSDRHYQDVHGVTTLTTQKEMAA